VWAQQARLGTSAVNHATVIKMRAERRLADAVDKGQKAGQPQIATQGAARLPLEVARRAYIVCHEEPSVATCTL